MNGMAPVVTSDGGCVTSSRSSNTRTDEEHGGEEENGTRGEQKRWGGDEA